MSNKALTAELENSFEYYTRFVDFVATCEFENKVKPFLQDAGMWFIAGNGTYYIWKIENGKDVDIDPDTLPKWLYELLEIEIPGMDGNSLGTLMPDYKPE